MRTPAARIHVDERRNVLRRHPIAHTLTGPRACTAFAIPLLLALHWGMAAIVSDTNVLIAFIAAFAYGQFVLHAAGALVHETAHRLVFRARPAKLAFDLLLEVVLASFARQLRYQHEHVSSHHRYQGDYVRDYEFEDVCAYLARRTLRLRSPRFQRTLTVLTMFLHLLPLGFVISDSIMRPVYAKATGRRLSDGSRSVEATKPRAFEVGAFVLVSTMTNLALLALFGVWGWLYHVWSLSLFLGKWGVTNLGQSLSEHPGDDPLRPTRSTYWWGNALLFNTGYHHEHHVFPNVAWMNLPRLTALEPDVFRNASKRSYVGLWWDHIRADFSPSRWTPEAGASRVERCERAAGA